MIKNGETCGIKYKLNIIEYSNFKDDLIKHKCLSFNKSYQRKFDERLRESFLIYTNVLTITISLLYYL